MKDTNSVLPHIRLDFNINHPSIEECYIDGYQCALAGLEETENPFPTDSVEASHWLEGWWAAFYGEKPLFDLNNLPEEHTLEVLSSQAGNDEQFGLPKSNVFWLRFIEISGVLLVSAVIGYQFLDLVA